MKLVIAATPEVAIPTIEKLKLSEHQIVHLITQPDRPAGRGLELTSSPIGQKYECMKPENESELAKLLTDSDLLITIGYGRILSEQILQIPKYGGINLHFSLLPKWRGAAPVQRCLEAGDSKTGVTVFQMDKGMDTGEIWYQEEFQIPNDFYSAELFNSLAELGADAILKTLKVIPESSPKKQIGASSLAAKIDNSELIIDWTQPALKIRNKIRGLGPATFTNFRGNKLKISKVDLSDLRLPIGEILVKERDLFIGTADVALKVLTLTPAGKREQSGFDFANGARLSPGEKVA